MLVALGDLHGDWEGLHALPDALGHPDELVVIQVGDFGWFPQLLERWRNPGFPVLALDGNHEDFEWLDSLPDHPTEIDDNLWWIPRGCVLQLQDLRVGCLGGASSVDGWRMPFPPQERVQPEHVNALIDARPDILVTHAPPSEVIRAHWPPLDRNYWSLPPDWHDVSADEIQRLWDGLDRPPLYCGHMHRSVQHETVRILGIGEYEVIHAPEPRP